MTLIPNFPEDLLHLHHEWHLNKTRGAKAGVPGGGLEFLLFHRRFLARVYDRFRAEGRTLDVPVWDSVPQRVKDATAVIETKNANGSVERTSYAWSDRPGIDAAATRLQTRLDTFGSADHLGAFIEHSESGHLHGWLHAFASAAYTSRRLRRWTRPREPSSSTCCTTSSTAGSPTG